MHQKIEERMLKLPQLTENIIKWQIKIFYFTNKNYKNISNEFFTNVQFSGTSSLIVFWLKFFEKTINRLENTNQF